MRGANMAFLLIGLVLLFALGLRVRRGFKRYRLVQNGEAVIGRVVSQERSGEWKQSSAITFEFEDLMSRLNSAKVMDITESLYEGMPLAVFYHPENVEECVALCETIFGIDVGNGTSIVDR